MQQIYRQSDQQLEVFTTVFSPQVSRSGTRTRHVDAHKVVVAVAQYRSCWQRELDLNRGDRVQVLFKEDESWWFGRRTNGDQGYFPAACVEPLQGAEASRATPALVRRGSVPAAAGGAPCGCTSGRSTPKLLRKNNVRRPLDGTPAPEGAAPHGSPSLLHRVLAKSRRKSCPHLPHLPHRPVDSGSVNTAFQPD